MSSTRLNETMIAELSQHPGFEDLATTITRARKGDRRSISKLQILSIQISRTEFCSQWSGCTPFESVSEAFTKELATFEPAKQPNSKMKPPNRIFKSNDGHPGKPTSPFTLPYSFPKWRQLAAEVNFPVSKLLPGEKEVLGFIDRILIQGNGFGRRDSMRDKRISLPIWPRKLAERSKKIGKRTYQRAITHLEELLLIREVSIDSIGVRSFEATWWYRNSVDPDLSVWERAKQLIENPPNKMSRPRRADVASASQPCRTCDAPLAHSKHSPTPYRCFRLGPVGMRHISGRLTSNFNPITPGLGLISPLYHENRSSPCLPNGQARRSDLSEPHQERQSENES